MYKEEDEKLEGRFDEKMKERKKEEDGVRKDFKVYKQANKKSGDSDSDGESQSESSDKTSPDVRAKKK